MTGEEFRALQDAAGLTVRATATLLGVSASTVQRWRDAEGDRTPIPAWAVERLRDHAATH